MANARSPNYPGISLPDAIDRIRKVYEVEHMSKAEPLTVVKAMGYSVLSGKAMTVLSALKKYGLLEEVGKLFKVSNDALIILVEPLSSTERADALRRAAFSPPLFAEIHENYGETNPSDENLKAFLLRKGFLPSTVDAPIRNYRETIGVVNALPKADNEDSPELDEDSSMNLEQQTSKSTNPSAAHAPVASAPPAVSNGPKFMTTSGKPVGGSIPVTSYCNMTIVADGPVTQEGLARLIDYVNLIKSWYPATNELPQ